MALCGPWRSLQVDPLAQIAGEGGLSLTVQFAGLAAQASACRDAGLRYDEPGLAGAAPPARSPTATGPRLLPGPPAAAAAAGAGGRQACPQAPTCPAGGNWVLAAGLASQAAGMPGPARPWTPQPAWRACGCMWRVACSGRSPSLLPTLPTWLLPTRLPPSSPSCPPGFCAPCLPPCSPPYHLASTPPDPRTPPPALPYRWRTALSSSGSGSWSRSSTKRWPSSIPCGASTSTRRTG